VRDKRVVSDDNLLGVEKIFSFVFFGLKTENLERSNLLFLMVFGFYFFVLNFALKPYGYYFFIIILFSNLHSL